MTEKISGNKYFLGINTSSGFKHSAEDVLNSAEKLYIIKGGPGCGKSRLMEDVARAAEQRNMSVDRYFCSSDPTSLDGILINEKKLCIIDGTSPHCRDPFYPGAIDEIINLSEFWNDELLTSAKEQIVYLCDKKKVLYNEVYSYMKGLDFIFDSEKTILNRCVNFLKIQTAVNKIFKKAGYGSGFKVIERQIESVGMRGNVFFDTYQKNAGKIYYISDTRRIASILYDTIVCELKRRNFSVNVSRDPMRKMSINSLYVPELGIAFVDGSAKDSYSTTINTDRFIFKEQLKENKNKLRTFNKIRKEIEEQIMLLFKDISTVHFALEDIYIKAMDFKRKEKYTEELINKIFVL